MASSSSMLPFLSRGTLLFRMFCGLHFLPRQKILLRDQTTKAKKTTIPDTLAFEAANGKSSSMPELRSLDWSTRRAAKQKLALREMHSCI